MSDPIRTKKGSVYAEMKVKTGEKEEYVKLNALVDADRFYALTEEQQKN